MISYDKSGSGPTIIFVAGAFNDRTTCQPLAQALEGQFTVVTYDRRGRGASTPVAAPYTIEQEVADLAWLIAQVGEPVHVFGYSSGALLALHAAVAGLPIQKLALYEPPTIVDAPPPVDDHVAALIAMTDAGEAVEYFQTRIIGMPEEIVVQLRNAPFRAGLEALAPSLIHDALLVRELPGTLAAAVKAPTLVLVGSESPPQLQNAARALATPLPDATLRVLPGQTHDLSPAAIAPVIAPFLST